MKMFIDKLIGEGKTYITKEAFIQRFWSAFTYEQLQIDSQIDVQDN